MRWAHFAAGITWVGQLYFFVLVNGPSLRETDGDRALLASHGDGGHGNALPIRDNKTPANQELSFGC